jgi:hypothetical protein
VSSLLHSSSSKANTQEEAAQNTTCHALTKAGPVDRMSSSLSAVYEPALVYTALSANNMSPKQDADWSNCRHASLAKMIMKATTDVGITTR